MSVMYKGKKVAETVDTPVQGIVTQAEFDALPVEEQNKGLYVIDDGQSGGGGSSEEVYSTEETRIGTWIDGKPLYRKVIKVTTPAGGKSSVEVAKLGVDVDSVVNLAMCIEDIGGQVTATPYYWGSSSYAYLFYNKLNSTPADRSDTLRIAVSSSFENKPASIIIEYTKTTDQGVTA